MQITPDNYIYFGSGFFNINQTILFSWFTMFIIIILAIVFRLTINSGKNISNIQNYFEMLVLYVEDTVKSSVNNSTNLIFPFISTMFLYIFFSNLLSIFPGVVSPTSSLSTTVGLALSTFLFSIFVGIKTKGIRFFKKYFEPFPIMLPLNIIGDLSNIVSMSFRLFGNIMSSRIILIILYQITFLSIGAPVLINLLGVITGVIQVYIFTILSMIILSK